MRAALGAGWGRLARTLLSEHVGTGWVQKSARNDEAGLELQNLLGMDKDQFTKVAATDIKPLALKNEATVQANHEMELSFQTADFKEGVAHYLEKRAARFTGR